ncbi:MAG TPA: glycoside hydrolase family 3 N-terminal domain-containing protein [Steroidobacteraceae bacterium]|nr:glycoside hydrolase family 3 N-terminal domain-containing protein [Steroidobacteraceae bacterium]
MRVERSRGRRALRRSLIGLALAVLFAAGPSAGAGDATVHPALWPARPPAAPSPDTEAFVSALLARMSLEEKIGQMIQADIASITPADLRTYKLGAVLAGGGAAPGGEVRTTPAAWLDLADALYRAELENASTAHTPIPLLFGIDAVHGNAKIVGATVFPHNIGLGAAHDVELIERIGAATAQEVAVTGIDWTFAPTVAVARDVRWGRSYESYSDDPQLVAAYAAAMVHGLQGERARGTFMSPGHTLSSVKHFLGDGGTEDGRDQGDNRASEATLMRVHDAGYPPAIDAGALIVMASFSGWQGVKMHANPDLLTTILKGRLGFDGFIVGDWNAHEEIPGCTKFSCPEAIRAGLDMFMAPDSWRRIYANTLAQVRAGEIPEARIDDAVRRILRVKALAGLFTRAAPKARPGAGDFAVLGSAAHREIARRAVRESLVLLKNAGGVLPLSPRAHLLVAGVAADRIDRQAGGWTIDWQGDHNSNADFPGGTSIYAALRAAVTAAGGTVTLSPDGSFRRRPDAAIVVFGEAPYAEFEGDRETLVYGVHDRASIALLRTLHARGIPTVSVFLSGRPLWVNPELNASDAFVAAWLPGTEGGGIADVLLARPDGSPRFDFDGRLSFPWPATGMPVTYDEADATSGALFPRGYGLSYAHGGEVAALSEDPRLAGDRGDASTLFQSAHVTAPWSAFIADGLASVRLTDASQASPEGTVTVTHAGADLAVRWNGSGTGVFWIGGRPVDLRSAVAHMAIAARLEVTLPASRPVWAGPRCASGSQAEESGCGRHGEGLLEVSQLLAAVAPGHAATLTLPLACFRRSGAALASVAGPFELRTAGALGLRLTDVRFVAAAAAGCHPGIRVDK